MVLATWKSTRGEDGIGQYAMGGGDVEKMFPRAKGKQAGETVLRFVTIVAIATKRRRIRNQLYLKEPRSAEIIKNLVVNGRSWGKKELPCGKKERG